MSNPVFFRERLRGFLESRIQMSSPVGYESNFFSDPGPDLGLGSEILIPSLLLEAGLEVNNNCKAICCAHD